MDKITVADSDLEEHEQAQFHDELLNLLKKIGERRDLELKSLLEQNLAALREIAAKETATTDLTPLVDALREGLRHEPEPVEETPRAFRIERDERNLITRIVAE